MPPAIDYELASVRLLKSVFLPNPEYDESKGLGPRGQKQAEIVLSIKNSADFSGSVARFTQNFRIERSSQMPFTLEVEYGAVFRTGSPVPEGEQAPYISRFFPHAVFPYLREYVSEITVRGGFPPILLHLAFSAGGSGSSESAPPDGDGPKPVFKWIH
jgi:hypothetical protein